MPSSSILRIDSSAQKETSVSRKLADQVVERLSAPDAKVVSRYVGEGLPALTSEWLAASGTPEAERTAEQTAMLDQSNDLIAELQAADTIVISLPIYNFGVPSGLKAWVDLVARAGITFRYTETGPVGLLDGKRAILTVASGGTEVGSPIDFATNYLRHVLNFIGITEVDIVASDRLMLDPEASAQKAQQALEALAA